MIYAYECDRCTRVYNNPDLLLDVKVFEWNAGVVLVSRGSWHAEFQKWCKECAATIDGGRYASKA